MAAPKLTRADLDACEADPRWLGWGYLGERSRCGSTARVRAADGAVLRVANERGWTREALFHWCNGKAGRWFGDEAFGRRDRPTVVELAEANRRLFDLSQGWLPAELEGTPFAARLRGAELRAERLRQSIEAAS